MFLYVKIAAGQRALSSSVAKTFTQEIYFLFPLFRETGFPFNFKPIKA